jgi:drug/metabolite transporter (DMT)-like permease
LELWIPVTLAAAFLQNLRSALQKHLKGRLSTAGATFVRFGFGVPFALAYLAALRFGAGYPLPRPNAAFWFWSTLGGLTQIAATFLLVHLFSLRSFAAGTAYSRTEPAQAAVFGLLFLGDRLSFGVALAIGVSVTGVMLVSVAGVRGGWQARLASLASRAALVGLASGGLFGVSAVAYRAASLSLGGPNVLMQASFTLAATTLFQAALMAPVLALGQPGELRRVWAARGPAALVGFAGASASFGWFTAMTLQDAATVRSLAQVELLFTFAASALVFRERITKAEALGCAAVAAGVVILLWVR